MRFEPYPPAWATWLVAAGIYANFFTHHWLPDARWVLFAAIVGLYGRTWVAFTPDRRERRMSLLVGFLLCALFIWGAENIGTFSRAWLYPSQRAGWSPVPPSKIGAWYLLMIISFVLTALVQRPARAPVRALAQPAQ